MNTKKIIQDNLAVVLENAPNLTAQFYATLFQRHPELARLFGRRPAAVQEKMLLEAIGAVVDHLDDLPWLDTTLRALGGKHVTYGVTDEMYPMVAGALMETLEQASREHWNEPTRLAWNGALNFLAERMQLGAREYLASVQAEGTASEADAHARSPRA